jgi:glucosamine-6-phosphate isomerase
MQLRIFTDGAALATAAAEQIIQQVVAKPNSLICLAGGETPRASYAELVRLGHTRKIDFTGVHFVSLDEWLGIPPNNSGSCFYFLQETVFSPLGILPAQVCFFDALTTGEAAECNRINEFVDSRGGIDLMLVGIGMNGHIGFNEPGFSPNALAHTRELDSVTQQVGQKYFSSAASLGKGITLGMRQLMEAQQVLLLATGHKKAPIVQQALEGEIGTALPATYLRLHKNGFVLLDREAASKLGNQPPVAG